MKIIFSGFPRVYRRLLEGIRKVNLPAAQAAVVKQSIKASIRAPSTAYTTLQQAEIIDFVSKYANYAIQASGVPDFIVTAAKIFVKKSTAGKIFDIFMKAAPK